MKTRTRKAVLVMLVLATAALVAAKPAQATVRVDIGFFYDSLAPYGAWFELPRYGWVWSPQVVAVGWRPYTVGHWVYADGYGWTWLSDEPWGWATDHYGRWLHDPDFGWIWVPGYEWAPAWVDWVAYDGWVGWAPLPPSAIWSVSLGFAPRYSIPYDRYVFVEPRHLASTSWRRYAAPREHCERFARAGRRVTRYQAWDGAVVNRSVSYEPATQVRIVDVESPRALRRSLDRGRLTVFRPQVARNARLVPARRGEAPRALRRAERVGAAAVVARSPRVETRRDAVRSPRPTALRSRVERLRTQERRVVAQPSQRPAPTVGQRLERGRRPAVAPSRTPRERPALARRSPRRAPAVSPRLERSRWPSAGPRRALRPARQVAQAPRRGEQPQLQSGRGRGRGENPPARSGRYKKPKGGRGGG